MMKLNIKDKSIKELHDTAMGLVNNILFSPLYREQVDEEGILELALKLETSAANKVHKNKDSEPLRSILYRSAANLAIRCCEYEEAIRLATEWLKGFTTEEIKKELEAVINIAKSYV